ncbi:MAG: ring-cleaving dioxygenase [Thermomicrobiales bacterium]|nr:ring-cleaving dioxygenase [Thermomicrobiales bacterium]
MELTGIHHLTAISAQIRENKRFYTETIGMRLVKRSVNQDDVSAYHLFYADAKGSPGTDVTFFDWPIPPERRGVPSISRTALRIDGAEAFTYWRERLTELGVTVGDVHERDGRITLDFEDPEGQRLTFVDDGGAGESFPWAESPVPAAFQVRGLGPITITVPRLDRTDELLRLALSMHRVRSYPHPDDPAHTVRVYAMGAGGPGAELHVVERPGLPIARQGAGGVHHVAFRIPDADYDAWADHLDRLGIGNSGKVDRFWFRSLYFREPGGNLFEIATDGPGFAIDEDEATLGEKVVLAPFLEPHRDVIVANLKPLE